MQIEAVFFDLGKVLVDFDLGKAVRAVEARTHLSADEIRACVVSARIYEFEKGQLSVQEFFSSLSQQLEFQGSVQELRAAFDDIFSEMPHNVSAARTLAGHVRLGLISNTNASHIAFVEQNYDFFPLFECKIYSHEVQLRKPDPAIYIHSLEKMGVQADRSLFIDDLADNVRGAEACGMNAIHLPPGTLLKDEVHRYPELARILVSPAAG